MDYTGGLLERDGKGVPVIENREQHSGMQNVQNLEAVINEGLRVALLEGTPDQSLQVLLEHLGKAMKGERTYIFEQNGYGCDDNTYEWVADGVEPEKENLQNVPPEVCANWYRNFSIGKHIVIESLEDIRETEPLQYENLKRQNIHSLVVVPLYDGKKVIGFYGVDNPPVKSMEYASNMLQTAAYFIVSSLKRRNLVRELQKRSYNVLHALSVDYLGIYQVNLDTGECEIYRNSERMCMDWAVNFADGYQTAMERYISRYVVPRDQERLRAVTKKEYVLAELRKKKKLSVRYQVKDSSHGLKYLEIHFSATEKTAEENCAIFAQRDVNAVVEQEEKYKLEARQSLENILEGARTGIWTIELEEGCAPRMYTDRTMRILLGVPDEIEPEECYQHWFENIEPDYMEMVQEAVREILETGRSEVIYPWNHPKLGKIYVRCGGVPDRAFKKPGACLNGYHQDITETMMARKKQEQAIMELLEKVRQANSAKSEFLSHMSHDLRTPINGILGMLSILEKSEEDLERQRGCRERIRVSTEHLLSLVNDVLLISKLESGRPVVVEEPFDLHDTLENSIAILYAQAEAEGIRLVLEEVDLQHSRLVGNPLHVKQILINIIDNALKYNRPNGFVFVRVKEIACRGGIAKYRFVIEDTGIGIGEEFKKHIFEPFTQEHQDARTHYNGVGLGMSTVKKLVDQMKGTIEVDSQIGKGSVFLITLPIKVDEEWGAPPAGEGQDGKSDIAGMHVLLVEDNEINCEIVEFMLEEADAEVVTANDGRAAVDIFVSSDPGTFDCVLMDLMMPVMSGYEATRVIRSLDRPDAKDVPIIALSANAFEEDIAMAKDAGMNEHLAKPVDIRKMFKVMSRLRR
ncbi:response regulator [Clostridiaceae bacterium]|nr:response regulator [Clostridiaceae bacterium]RKI07886.1 response regulator [bacterium 1XD21-70]